MCICINCRHINSCTSYNFIKKQHNKNFINLSKTNKTLFIPHNNTMKINAKIQEKIYYININWDLIECLSFIEKPGAWLKQ